MIVERSPTDTIAVIERRIVEAAAWSRRSVQLWGRQRDLRDPLLPHLRDPSLRPASFRLLRKDEERRHMTDLLAGLRAERLSPRSVRATAERPDTVAGRILIYAPDQTLSEGASEQASGGFLNVDDEPAWDMWLYYEADHLIAWVPEEFVAGVDAGIAVNSTLCLNWAEDINTALRLRWASPRWREDSV